MKKLLVLLVLIILVILGIVFIFNYNSSNSVEIKNQIELYSNDNVSIYSYLVNYNWKVNNDSITTSNWGDLSMLYNKMKKQLVNVSFTKIEFTNLIVETTIFKNNKNLVLNESELTNREDFYFSDVVLVVLDENLNTIATENIKISENKFEIDTTKLPQNQNLYLWYTLESNYGKNVKKGNYAQYGIKIKT